MAELRQITFAMLARALGLQGRQGVLGRATPERKGATGQAAVDLGPDTEAVVGVVRLVLDHLRQLVPDRAPTDVTRQGQSLGKPAWKAQREVEAHQGALAALLQIIEDGREARLG